MIAALLVRWGLSQRVAGILAYVLPALAFIVLCGLVWLWIDSREAADDAANVETGRIIEREEALTETITRVEEANDAREDNRTRTDDQRRSDCLRRSRTPENC